MGKTLQQLEESITSVMRLASENGQLATVVLLEPDEENTGVYSHIYCSKCNDKAKLMNLVSYALQEKAKEIQESE